MEQRNDSRVETIDCGEGVKAHIEWDSDPINPRKDYDNFGHMICWHRRYDLGDEHDHKEPADLWKDLLGDDEMERIDAQWQGAEEAWREANPGKGYSSPEYDKFIKEARRAEHELIRAKVAEKYVVLPLFLYDHSGITMSTGKFSCPWDSGQVGWIYVSHDEIKDNWSVKSVTDQVDYKDGQPTKSALERAEDLLKGEVETYDQYLTGQVYGYIIETPDEENADSCWGFFGLDYVREEAEAAAKHYVEDYADPMRMAGADI